LYLELQLYLGLVERQRRPWREGAKEGERGGEVR
jgi:hypothetical protein